LAIRCRRGGDGKYDAIRLQAGETDEDQFLRGEGALDLLIEIEAIVVTPA
jgi:hypothetical protein